MSCNNIQCHTNLKILKIQELRNKCFFIFGHTISNRREYIILWHIVRFFYPFIEVFTLIARKSTVVGWWMLS